jgi:hypothetical protein
MSLLWLWPCCKERELSQGENRARVLGAQTLQRYQRFVLTSLSAWPDHESQRRFTLTNWQALDLRQNAAYPSHAHKTEEPAGMNRNSFIIRGLSLCLTERLACSIACRLAPRRLKRRGGTGYAGLRTLSCASVYYQAPKSDIARKFNRFLSKDTTERRHRLHAESGGSGDSGESVFSSPPREELSVTFFISGRRGTHFSHYPTFSRHH